MKRKPNLSIKTGFDIQDLPLPCRNKQKNASFKLLLTFLLWAIAICIRFYLHWPNGKGLVNFDSIAEFEVAKQEFKSYAILKPV